MSSCHLKVALVAQGGTGPASAHLWDPRLWGCFPCREDFKVFVSQCCKNLQGSNIPREWGVVVVKGESETNVLQAGRLCKNLEGHGYPREWHVFMHVVISKCIVCVPGCIALLF